ncbi:SDR family oxidoreductase [Paenibacillus crassostreae]|uniref:Short-chain dehydrogenase n=1 Tax=Paenibacillus crassostreae TaxID=1763538 RepID=A0A167GGE7_9BACL|nr:SDR family oxidoreductase [Paenibacillus crassostreae]AOZ91969.1 short-chain dehydrogenase [Paenibacillus crassostreae]OAB77548.1 short-chain dehydrogenase [Paenibacillus crassostreae]
MDNTIDGIAFVTGCSSGFGLLISVELARKGFTVLSGMRRLEDKDSLIRAACMAGVESSIHVVELDVMNEEQVHEVVQQIQEQYGRLDLLVNNAGSAYGGMIEEVPLSVWRQQFEVNFMGMVSVTQAVLPLMREGNGGRIIQMSSISGGVGFPGFGPYASSKFALEGFSECLAMEVKQFGIDVVLVEPGAYGTPIWGKSFSQLKSISTSPYKGLLDRILQYSQRSATSGGDPMDVALLIAKIATIPSPGFRYRIPKGTTLTMVAKYVLPTRWFQRIILYYLYK